MAETVEDCPAKKAKLDLKSTGTDKKTNWCDLPMEMRDMCIRRMDVQSKFHMRNTSHIERLLVDSEKLNFEKVEFYIYYNIKVLFWKKTSQEKPDFQFRALRNTKEYQIVLLESAQLMKMATIENLRICYEDNYSEAPEAFRRLAPFRIKNLCCDSSRDWNSWLPWSFFLNSSEWKIEEFRLERTQWNTFRFADLLNVKFPKSSKLRFYKLPTGIIDYIKKWIRDDVDTGTELRCEILDRNKLRWLTHSFEERKILSKRQVHRFRTDNPLKELILSIDRSTVITVTWQVVGVPPKRTNPMRAAKRKSSD